MKASELMARLLEEQRAHGDRDVSIVKADDEGEINDVGEIDRVEMNHDSTVILIHAIAVGC